ncbi:DUF4115 domain-containing protein [Ligilactobacillus equi]|uniref:helix-turn-helix domain-containing protein n=1 Tax=Ligilactobacillus equi TaxID=137357 RepID=UPI002ED50A1B
MTVGETLKQARTERGLTLDDLQNNTKIQKRYLIAIEENNFKSLPGDFYVRAFIRQYAQTVGAPVEDIMGMLDQQLGQEKPVVAEESTEEEPKSRSVLREKISAQTPPSILDKVMSHLPAIIIVAVVVLILGAIYVTTLNSRKAQDTTTGSDVAVSREVESSSTKTSSKKQSSQKDTNSESETANSEAKKSSTKKAKANSKQTITATSSSGTSFNYELKSSAKENVIKLSAADGTSWLAVSANGSTTWQGTLADGKEQEVTLPEGTTAIRINVGNSQATKLEINGKKFDFLKENSSATVRTINLTVAE